MTKYWWFSFAVHFSLLVRSVTFFDESTSENLHPFVAIGLENAKAKGRKTKDRFVLLNYREITKEEYELHQEYAERGER